MNFIDQQDYSSNDIEPIEACKAVGEMPTLKEPKLIGDYVLWLEQRPNEGGRITALIRPWMQTESQPQELTPSPINLKSRFHGYGGGVFTAFKKDNLILTSWIDDDSNGCLWNQSWIENDDSFIDNSIYLKPVVQPMCLSKKGDFHLADGLIDFHRNRWLGVMERDRKDYIVQFLLDKKLQEPLILYQANDFLGYLTLSRTANYLAWVEWQKPFMPWDSSQLLVAEVDQKGAMSHANIVGGDMDKETQKFSVFQPIWLPNGELVVSEDETGWWNVMIGTLNLRSDKPFLFRKLWPMEAETAMPQWVSGMSTIAASGEKIIAAICTQGVWNLCELTKDGMATLIDQPFTDLVGIDAQPGRVLLIAGNSENQLGLVEIDLQKIHWKYTNSSKQAIFNKSISVPISFWFKGFKDRKTHSWYYPPIRGTKSSTPLLVKSHSGPTAMARTTLNLEIQFWTSRGWGVLDVNYGGSSGFGRDYRERLKGSWGEVDVMDCIKATEFLIAEGKADKDFIAIEGSSSAGLTTLGCLYLSDIFKVGACKYAVTDLVSMADSTHRFEEYYLNHLLGSLPSRINIYEKRSPINNCNKIKSPIIFFQGLKDKVVIPSQTKNMYRKLLDNHIPVELYTFEDEGHGFKNGKNKIRVLELTEDFFKRHLKL